MMGYDMELISIRKKKLEEIQDIIEDYTYKDMFVDFLFISYESNTAMAEEYGKWILSESRNLFKDFFIENKIKIENGEKFIIKEEIYDKMIQWLKNKLEKTNLLDIAETDSALYEFEILITAYRSMISANIDFEEELLVFEHDW
ncbi:MULTISPECIES: hypothetical protein [Lachnospiraceae]|uniref:hypothetical protein n=1 Tax=Lachnospiraceae TaxID=186803 RepID=UPI0011C1591B|nr:hypothetical protein [Hungatella hathewayi]